jgi:serine/threonine protein kinase
MAFRDGLGERQLTKDPTGAGVEALCLRRELSAVPSFEFALRERVTRLAGFHHAYYARVRGVERSTEFDQAMTITSDATSGIRLSALLDTSHERRLAIELDVALCLIRQLVPAVAILHETARDAAHGALGPERLIVTPNGRLVILEYVLGSALEQLLFSRERYWTELRIALPRVAGLPRFDHLADVTQIGVVALSLILGRTLRDDEYPARIAEVVASATATTARGEAEPLPPALRSWLHRALQLDTRHSFPSAIEARIEFEKVLAESGCDASPERLDGFLTRYHAPDPPKVVAPIPAVQIGAKLDPTTESATQIRPTPDSTTESAAQIRVKPDLARSGAFALAAVPDLKPHFPAASAETTTAKVPSVSASRARPLRSRLVKMAAAAVVILVLLAGGALVGARRFLADESAPTATGTLVITTNPAGAEAIVDGVRRGATPLTLTLIAGSHQVELRGRGEPRVLPVTIAPGLAVAQYIDLPIAPAPVEPVTVAAQNPAATPVPTPSEDSVGSPGWIAIGGKLEVQLYEAGRLLGTSKIDRIMVPAGRHDLELINELIGYRGTRSVQVLPGKVTTITIDPPKGTMAINALPWAEVWMDGTKVGDTPIGNLTVTAGSHDVVFRHPDFGEQHETVLVTLTSPTRLSVDMRKP